LGCGLIASDVGNALPAGTASPPTGSALP